MAGFSDLVTQAQPAIFGGGVSASATAGRTWLWRFVDVNDTAGTPINLAAITGTCKVLTGVGGTVVATLTFTGGTGEFTVGLDEASTVGLYAGVDGRPYACWWSLVLDNGTDEVQVWGLSKSSFNIFPEA